MIDRLAITLAVFPLLPLAAAAQDATTETRPRIVAVGASVTAGFRLERYIGFMQNARQIAEQQAGHEIDDDEYRRRIDSVKPGDVLAAAYGREIETFGDNFLFSDPPAKARKQLDAALATEPALVVGIDLVFWFGYGRQARPGTEESLRARLTLQRQGLALLDELLEAHPDTTLVVGDYPDLTGAVPLMISPDMIPTAAELDELNDRLAEWANARPRVRVFPLSASLERLRAGDCRLAIGGEERTVGEDEAFQLARVHPTRLGVALIVRDLTRWLVGAVGTELWPDDATDEILVAAALGSGDEPASPAPAGSGK